MITKVDTREVFSELYYRAVMVIIIILILLSMVGIGIGWLYSNRNKKIYSELLLTGTALRKSQDEFRTILYSIGDAVIITDIKGFVRNMNHVAEQLTGWIEAEAIGEKIDDVFHIVNEETFSEVENPIKRVLQEGVIVGLANHTLLISKDGKKIPIADSAAPIKNTIGDITGVVLVFRDQTEERKAQKALAESEVKFRETVKYLDEGYYSVTADGLLIDHNQAFNRILGFDIAMDLRGAKLPDFWQNPEDRKIYLQELIKCGFIKNYLINAKKIGGEEIVVMANSHIVKDEKGGVVRIEGTYNDFTKLKQAEKALTESEIKYRTLFETAQVGMYRSKTDGSAFLDVNDKFAEIFGFDRNEMIGMPGHIRWADPEDRDKMMSLLKKQAGVLFNYECKVLDRNGKNIDILASIKLHSEEGYLDGIMLDITDRKRAEKAVQDNERHFRELIESLPQLFWTCRVDGPCDYLSKQWVEYTGIVEAEQLGYRWLEQLHHEDRDRTVSEWMEKVKTGNVFDIEFRIRRNDGIYRWFKTRAVPMHDAEGNIIKWFGSNTDIDEIKKAEEQLHKLNNDLEQSNVELEQFAYVASHDLQEPLRMVSSFTQLLAKRYHDKIDKEADEFIDYIVDGASRMQRLIQDLLSYSRITTRGEALNMVDAHQALGSAISNLQILIKESGTIVTNDELPKVVADYTQLVQLFQNLIGNSIKFHGEEPSRIHISSELLDNEWVFSIKDNGIGIDPTYFEKIFIIFQRLHSGNLYPGTGIGLAICSRIVQRHGGKIWVESELGKGSVFRFTFKKNETSYGIDNQSD